MNDRTTVTMNSGTMVVMTTNVTMSCVQMIMTVFTLYLYIYIYLYMYGLYMYVCMFHVVYHVDGLRPDRHVCWVLKWLYGNLLCT